MGASSLRTGRASLHGSRLVFCALLTATLLAACAQSALAAPVGQIAEFNSSNGLNAGSFPRGIAAGPDGNLWFADDGATKAIGRINPSTGHIDEFNLPAGSKPYSVAFGADRNMWFTDNGTTKAIGRISPSTGHIDEFGASSGLLAGSSPRGIATGPDGNLWFADAGATKAIGRINPSTGHIDEFSSGLLPGSSPGGMIAQGADGNMWFADQGTTKAIGRINPSTQHIDEFHPLSLTGTPSWIAPGPDGNLWFTEGAPFIGGPAKIGRIDPAGAITEFGTADGLNAGSKPLAIASGPDGNLWFGDRGATSAIGRVTTAGQINEYTASTSVPVWLWPGADGNVWFGDQATTRAIGRIGTGAPQALVSPPTVAGSRRAGDAQTCGNAQWATWAGVSPFTIGFTWFLAGAQIPGQNGQTYVPRSSDVGQPVACKEFADYALPLIVPTFATSAAVTVQPPNLSRLKVSPQKFSLAGRRVHGLCVARTRKNNGNAGCRRRLKLKIRFNLGAASAVVFTLKRVQAGRKVKGRCVRPTKKNRKHKRCKRLTAVKHTRFTRNGRAGGNKFTVKGKFGSRKLGPGTYELVATPRVNGHTGSPRTFTFKIAG
jgi:streptogramin lyase